MRQPELGRTLVKIRKDKGITQEELVNKCNVTVRTIQRIEAGDVTPRPLTLKLIADALGCDTSAFTSPEIENHKATRSWFHGAIITNIENASHVASHIRIAWIAGIIYFLTGFPEAAFEYDWFKNGSPSVGIPAYILVKVLAMVSFTLFIRGFIIIGSKHDNSLLTYGSYLFLAVFLFNYNFDIFSVGHSNAELKDSLGAKAISFGVAEVIFGLGLRRISESFGPSARYAGSLEILAGLLFLTVILSPLGLVLLIPAEIIEVYLLFKYGEWLIAKHSAPGTV